MFSDWTYCKGLCYKYHTTQPVSPGSSFAYLNNIIGKKKKTQHKCPTRQKTEYKDSSLQRNTKNTRHIKQELTRLFGAKHSIEFGLVL